MSGNKPPKPNIVDGVNYITREIETPAGRMQMSGMSVRAMRNLLADAAQTLWCAISPSRPMKLAKLTCSTNWSRDYASKMESTDGL